MLGIRTIASQAIAASRNRAYTLVAAYGSFALTGQAAGLKEGRTLVASRGTFSLTGQAAALGTTRLMAASQGSYGLSGETALLKVGRVVAAAQGSFALAGQNATLTYAAHSAVAAGQGSFTLTGQAAGLLATRLLTAARGTYDLTGEDVAFARTRVLRAAAGSFALTGMAAALRATRILSAGQGAYVLTGEAARLLRGYRIAAGVGTFVLVGKDVAFAVVEPPEGITEHIQKPETDPYVVLFELDATALGGDIYRFTSSAFADAPISFGGHEYSPMPVEAEGWEWNGKGPLPTPVIRVSNVTLAFSAIAIAYGDLRGATLTRIRTYRRFLDDEADADPDAHLPLDIYRIDRKRAQTKTFMEWELASVLDQQEIYLPRRPILRGACTHTYRRRTASGFDYSRATCPYAGTFYFTQAGTITTPQNDVCGKRLSDCKKRFGSTAALPTRAFPGVARTPTG